MKLNKAILVAGALMQANLGMAFPAAGPASQLDVLSRDLTSAAQNLAYTMSYTAPNSLAYQDAVTLVDAAQHFQEEVELGPQDLDVDFNAIEQTFEQLKSKFVYCQEFVNFPAVRTAWFRVEESNTQMRSYWYGGVPGGGGFPGGNPGGGFPGGIPGGGFPGGGFPGRGGFPGGGFPGRGGDDHGGWHGGDHGGWHGGDDGRGWAGRQ